MRDWNDYKDHINAVDPEIAKDIKETEEVAAIISAIIERRNSLGGRNIKMKPKSKNSL